MLVDSMRKGMRSLLPGLMAIPGLQSPEDWAVLGSQAIKSCDHLRKEALQAPAGPATVALLDEMSDVICQVADAADFCRSVHPQKSWRMHAERACLDIGSYISGLNGDVDLMTRLGDALAQKDSTGKWSSEAERVGQRLMLDFEKGGCSLKNNGVIPLWRQEQEICIRLDNSLSEMSDMKTMRISEKEYNQLPKASLNLFRKGRDGEYHADVQFTNLGRFTCKMPNSELRKRAYISCFSSLPSNLNLLDDLVKVRFSIARALEWSSYAHMTLRESIARTPEAVKTFLGLVSEGLCAPATEHVNQLSMLKGSQIHAWDYWFYNEKARDRPSSMNEVFAFPCIMEGLSQILSEAFGIILREVEMAEGESWAPFVKKLVAEDIDRGTLGYVYLDLFDRPNKIVGCATYTLRCGKRLECGSYQIPIVAMVMRIPHDHDVSYSNLKTFLHEFGHALNSLVCRTEFQCLFGTRGPLDLVEISSHFMENFVKSPELLQLFSGVDPTGCLRSIPELRRLIKSESFGWSVTLQEQIQMAMVDQELFGESPCQQGETGEVVERIVTENGSLPFVKGTNKEVWHGHFSGYGACYYSYSYARCISALIWDRYMAADPLKRESGTHVKQKVFSPGGAVHPQMYVTDLLGSSSLSQSGSGWLPQPTKWLAMEGGVA